MVDLVPELKSRWMACFSPDRLCGWLVGFAVAVSCLEPDSLSGAAPAPVPDAAASADRFWTDHIAPLLEEHCADCHSATRSKGGLDLSSLHTILRGGERGAAVVPGKPLDSNLYKFLLAEADPHMPPGKRKPLSAEEADLIRLWINKIPVVTGPTPSASSPPSEVGSVSGSARRPAIAWRPPTAMDPAQAVDRFLKLAWEQHRIKPAKQSTDATFLRRLFLDLVGRIPAQEEAATLLDNRSSDRRSQWIQQLLKHPEHPRHLREVFDVVLMDRRGAKAEDSREKHLWFQFLESSFRENRPWDEVVRQLIVARPGDAEDRGSTWFLYERRNNAQAMAEAIAPVVYGVQIKCAQCHDHMVAREIKQAHYWGTVAAFLRSKNVETPDGPAVAESAIGGFVSFANLKKESQQALLTFFNQRQVDEVRPKEGEKEVDAPELYRVPPPAEKTKPVVASIPKFSRREAFARVVTEDNPLLARAMVNRIWALLFGRGIVHPVDLMDSKHPPTHPELLDWLSEDFARHGYDVRRLIDLLCRTKAYQLDSRADPVKPSKPSAPKSEKAGTGLPEADAFARFQPKPLIAEQLIRSLLAAQGPSGEEGQKLVGLTSTQLRRSFAKEFPDVFAAEYQPSLQQAMFLSNSPIMENLLKPVPGSLSERLAREPDVDRRIQQAFQAVFLRDPDPEESRVALEFLRPRSIEAGVQQLLWSMFTSAEFQLNH
jgi:hypothetical protein